MDLLLGEYDYYRGLARATEHPNAFYPSLGLPCPPTLASSPSVQVRTPPLLSFSPSCLTSRSSQPTAFRHEFNVLPSSGSKSTTDSVSAAPSAELSELALRCAGLQAEIERYRVAQRSLEQKEHDAIRMKELAEAKALIASQKANGLAESVTLLSKYVVYLQFFLMH